MRNSASPPSLLVGTVSVAISTACQVNEVCSRLWSEPIGVGIYLLQQDAIDGVVRRSYTASAVEQIIIDKHTADTE
jgi:hypothetical protein